METVVGRISINLKNKTKHNYVLFIRRKSKTCVGKKVESKRMKEDTRQILSKKKNPCNCISQIKHTVREIKTSDHMIIKGLFHQDNITYTCIDLMA